MSCATVQRVGITPDTNPRYKRQWRQEDSKSMISYDVTYDISFNGMTGIPDCWLWLSEDCKYHFTYMPDKIKEFMDKNGSCVLT